MLLNPGRQAMSVKDQARSRKAVAPAKLLDCLAASGTGTKSSSMAPSLAAEAGRDVRCRDSPPQATASPPSPAKPASAAQTSWSVSIFSGKRSFTGSTPLKIQIVGEDGFKTDVVTLSSKAGWKEEAWVRATELGGTVHKGAVNVPSGVRPAAIIIEQAFDSAAKDRTYFSSIVLSAQGNTITFPADTFVYAGKRVIFDGEGRLPSQTPPALRALREQELKDLQGVGNPAAKAERKDGDRIYDYQIYDDLGSDKDVRPNLGGSAEFPYPRRLRTGRPNYPGTNKETKPTVRRPILAVPWMPLDDDFDRDKGIAFIGNTLAAALPAVRALLGNRSGKFADLKAVYKLYDNDDGELEPELPATKHNFLVAGFWRTVKRAQLKVADVRRNASKNTLDLLGQLLIAVFAPYDQLDDLLQYPAPFNISKRVNRWRTDEEFGRMYLAGLNPLVLTALKQLPATTSITLKDLEAHVEGQDVGALLKLERPRLFLVDFYSVHAEYADKVNAKYKEGERVFHAGHSVLYLRNDGHLVPIAIDLTTSSAKAPTVFTPASPPAVWSLVKAVFASMDSFHHQLYSHWLRTHCVMEPYLIATRRQLSNWHPVFNLIMPHFRYTLPINANARTLLIQAGGVIEDNFTGGEFAMAFSSAMYAKHWRFDTDALPADLKQRGLISESGEVLLDDYPYAQDGLLVWQAIEKYFTEYINLYYETDADVETDNEIQAWYTEVKEGGHPDKKEGWLPLTTRADLVRVLATMAWVGSAHHSAVNFGQYDYAAFMPGRSSLVSRAVPAPGTPAYSALAGASGAAADSLLLNYLGTPSTAAVVATIVRGLSTHAIDEQYLSAAEQPYLTDASAKALHAAFVKDILNVEKVIAERNADPKYVSRNPAKGGLPYKYMIASSGPGSTGQGVPYSVSI